MTTNRPLRVFLCHSSNDKPAVRELYQKLRAEPWIQPWLDEEELFPGMDWETEIEKVVEATDVVIVCLSNNSINKRGFVQKELRYALDVALEMSEETIFVIPLRLEKCTPPRSLREWQYVDYFEDQRERAFQRLLVSLKKQADSLRVRFEAPTSKENEEKPVVEITKSVSSELPTKDWIAKNKITLSNGMELMCVPAGKFLMGSNEDNMAAFEEEYPQLTVDIPYDYWIARFPITHELYNAYVKTKGIKYSVDLWEKKKDYPANNIKWRDALSYCRWLNDLFKTELLSGLVLRLPTEAEWEKAARGVDGREYPWGNEFDRTKCNTNEGGKNGRTPVGLYSPQGDSPYGCADMAGNVWEWTHSTMKEYPYKVNDGREDEIPTGLRVLRGGCFFNEQWVARCSARGANDFLNKFYDFIGFRVIASPTLVSKKNTIFDWIIETLETVGSS